MPPLISTTLMRTATGTLTPSPSCTQATAPSTGGTTPTAPTTTTGSGPTSGSSSTSTARPGIRLPATKAPSCSTTTWRLPFTGPPARTSPPSAWRRTRPATSWVCRTCTTRTTAARASTAGASCPTPGGGTARGATRPASAPGASTRSAGWSPPSWRSRVRTQSAIFKAMLMFTWYQTLILMESIFLSRTGKLKELIRTVHRVVCLYGTLMSIGAATHMKATLGRTAGPRTGTTT
mmetsp:Transcript_42728/g.62800  ORF Transcript_42728/g.62800 Transcript_42728/m.62800 type:complete len:235 (-) Transcript_42728:354-1058(-)